MLWLRSCGAVEMEPRACAHLVCDFSSASVLGPPPHLPSSLLCMVLWLMLVAANNITAGTFIYRVNAKTSRGAVFTQFRSPFLRGVFALGPLVYTNISYATTKS